MRNILHPDYHIFYLLFGILAEYTVLTYKTPVFIFYYTLMHVRKTIRKKQIKRFDSSACNTFLLKNLFLPKYPYPPTISRRVFGRGTIRILQDNYAIVQQ